MSWAADDPASWVVGVDSGGSGLRVALGRADGGAAVVSLVCAEPVRTGPAGIDARHLLEQLLPAVRTLLGRAAGASAARGAMGPAPGAGSDAPPAVAAVAVGAAGMATLGDDLRAVLPGALAEALGVRRLALAADAVTAYAGALGQRSGAVVAAGTGMIALGADLGGAGCSAGSSGADLRGAEPHDTNLSGTDPGFPPDGTPGPASDAAADSVPGPGPASSDPAPGSVPGRASEPLPGVAPGPLSGPASVPAPGAGWRRADGWGHLLGDCGSGAWIGRAGLEAALRAFDGRRGGSAALLGRLEAVLGPAAALPGLLYPRTDRAAVLASFAPEVGRCAAEDPVAAGILRAAARSIAEAAAAVYPLVDGGPVALTGGLFRLGEPLLAPLRAEFAEQLPRARLVTAAGDPLDGALKIASAVAAGDLRLPVDGRLLGLPNRSLS